MCASTNWFEVNKLVCVMLSEGGAIGYVTDAVEVELSVAAAI